MATIQGVYVALFGRPADPTGLAYFNTVTNNGANLNAIGNLASTAEYQGRFAGLNNLQIINSIYQSLFGRDADVTGLNFFANQLATGRQTINTIAINILDGATGSDLTTVNNKIAAANLYTAALDTGTEIVAYSGTAAADAGRTFLQGVTTTVPAQSAVDTAVANMVANVGTNPGSTFTLTTNVDAGPNFVGTANNDVYTASVAPVVAGVDPSTLNAADDFDGKAGIDTLNVTVSGGVGGAGVTNGASIKNVEIINVRNVSGATVAIDAQTVPGATQIWSDRSNAGLTITKLGDGAAAGVRGNGVLQNGDLSFGYATAATAATLAFADGTKAGTATTTQANEDANAFTVGLNGSATAATITSTGAANTVNNINLDLDTGGATVKTLTINAATDFTITGADLGADGDATADTWISGFAADATVTVTGAGKVGLGPIQANVKEVNASGNAGGVTVGGGFEATDKFTGGTGNDTLTAGVALTTGSADAGAGTGDRLIVTDDAVLATSTLAGKFTNFEILRTADGGGSTYNLANIAGITAIEVAGAAGTTFDGLNAQTITVVGDTVGGLTLNKTGVLPSGSDALSIAIDNSVLKNDDGVDVGTINVANIDVLNLSSVGGNLTPATESNSATIGGNADLETVNLTGDTAFNLITGGSTVDSVNASAFTAALTVNASGNSGAIEVLGGSGKNNLTGSSNGDVLKGGAAADTITGGLGADNLTGGAAADTFVIRNFEAGVVSGSLTVGAAAPANTDAEVITLTADGADSDNEGIIINYTSNGVAGVISGQIDVLAGSDIAVNDATALGGFVKNQVDALANVSATNALGVVTATADTNGSLTINSVQFTGTVEAANAVITNGSDVAQVTPFTLAGPVAVGQTYTVSVTLAGSAVPLTASFVAATTSTQDVVTGLVTAINANVPLAAAVTAAGVDATSFTITDDAPDNGGFAATTLVAAGSPVYAGDSNAVVTGAGPTLAVTGFDKIADFNAGGAGVLQFGNVIGITVGDAAATNAIAGTSVQVDGNGKVIFAAADDTLAEKVFTLQQDNTNITNNEVVFFEDAGNTYVYGAGVDTTNTAADFLVELTGVVGLTKITEGATNGDFTIA